MKLFFTIAVILVHLTGLGDERRQPDIVVIMADDAGYSDFGCYGGEIETPVLDKLAANGLRFSQFYNTGRCCPSRAALLTGVYPHQAGMGHMTRDRGLPSYSGTILPHVPTLAERLRQGGYRTMMTGKWHLGTEPKQSPIARGFDRFYGTRNFIDSYFTVLKHCPVFLDDKIVLPGTETPVNHLHPDQEWYTTDVFTDYALHFMDEAFKQHSDQPIFLYIAHNAPHFPLHAREEDTKKYRGRFRDTGWDKLRQQRYERMVKLGLIDKSWALSPADVPKWETYDAKLRDELDLKMALYSAIIDRMDQNIGRVVEKLRAAGRLDNTLFLFMVDNGVPGTGVHDWRGLFAKNGRNPETRVDNYPEWGRLGGWTSSSGRGWANLSNAPFRMYKRYTHEGGVATPLIVHWPDGLKDRNKLRHAPGHIIDIAPTCLNAAGLSTKGMEGQTLLPVFTRDSPQARTLFWEHEGNRAVRQGDYKLVAQHNTPWELYNMRKDRSELHDLTQSMPQKAAELKRLYEAWAHRVGAKPWDEVSVIKNKKPKK
ncbi:MAG: arylsulfatase [Verrucomicrobia subdivision 3 bacterium]|nr:arylsulfatase [Limisphaerales bacterium]